MLIPTEIAEQAAVLDFLAAFAQFIKFVPIIIQNLFDYTIIYPPKCGRFINIFCIFLTRYSAKILTFPL